jgi:hypothetical protein
LEEYLANFAEPRRDGERYNTGSGQGLDDGDYDGDDY